MANKGKHSYEFKPGDRIYKLWDVLGNADDHKTASKFQGPYVLLEKGTNDVYKLANFYTRKSLKNFIHVDKLRSSQGARTARAGAQQIASIQKKQTSACTNLVRHDRCRYIRYGRSMAMNRRPTAVSWPSRAVSPGGSRRPRRDGRVLPPRTPDPQHDGTRSSWAPPPCRTVPDAHDAPELGSDRESDVLAATRLETTPA